MLLSIMTFIPVQEYPIKLYLLSDHGKVGDHNQVLGIKRAFENIAYDQNQEEILFEDLDTKKISSSEIQKKIEKDKETNKVIVVGAGEGGIDGIQQFPQNPYLMICLTSHMFLERYKDPELLKKVMFIALPTHDTSFDHEKMGRKLIETIGVAHNRQVKGANSAYQKYQSKLPEGKTYLGVVLGGDAPTPTKEINLFTKEDAEKVAKYAIKRAQETNATLLVLNGPRTGQHTREKEKIPTAHREGKLDAVTAHFKDILETKLGKERVKVFDFQFDQKPPYNSFDLVLGVVRATHGEMLIPGDSTSMISEAIDTMAPQRIIVYENSAMNEVHHAHIASEFEAGRAAILKDQIVTVPSLTTKEPYPSAASVIAGRLWDDMNI